MPEIAAIEQGDAYAIGRAVGKDHTIVQGPDPKQRRKSKRTMALFLMQEFRESRVNAHEKLMEHRMDKMSSGCRQ
jgi:hypothetical protein